MDFRITRASKVFSNKRHNAFTSIAKLNKNIFITFRSADFHASMDGIITTISSSNLDNWETINKITMPKSDLRDPKIIKYQDKLLLYFASRTDATAYRQNFMCYSEDGVNFSDPVTLTGIPEGKWLWSVCQNKNMIFGTIYTKNKMGFSASIYQSSNGREWRKLIDLPFPGGESFIDADQKGTLWILSRDDSYGKIPTLYSIQFPYKNFDIISRLPLHLEGPMLKRFPTGCLIVGRGWDYPERNNLHTDIYWLEDNQKIKYIQTLPSGGDTGYAGTVELANNKLLMSYYSAHEHKMAEPHENDFLLKKSKAHAEHTCGADIFLAEISYKPLNEQVSSDDVNIRTVPV